VLAAIGGMVIPALLYLAIAGGDNARGWGIPMATDIAFALGALTLASRFAPPGLKPLLLTLAIVDDIGAILVIALFYSGGIEWVPLAVAVGGVGLALLAARAHVRALAFYVVLGAVIWYATFEAGIHPTIAGVVLGLLGPATPFQRPKAVSVEARRIADETTDHPDPPDADAPSWMRLAWLSRESVSPLARVEHVLLPWTSFVILPIFALANAGVVLSSATIRAAATDAVAIGIFVGLVVGKPLGVFLGSQVAVRSRAATLPGDVGWGDLAGMGSPWRCSSRSWHSPEAPSCKRRRSRSWRLRWWPGSRATSCCDSPPTAPSAPGSAPSAATPRTARTPPRTSP
jgi:NhaA family Na+:H+ antiporter